MRDGIGMDEWGFVVYGTPTDISWRYLVDRLDGIAPKRPPWDLNPDYQRGPVWTLNQQERFIGHVLGGGETPLIYVQRYENPKHAPKGTNYLDLSSEVIDGQQRLRAVRAFVTGEINGQAYHHGAWHSYPYQDLSVVERRATRLSSRFVFVDLPRTDRLRFYLRLNGGVAHTEAELDRVRVMLAREED